MHFTYVHFNTSDIRKSQVYISDISHCHGNRHQIYPIAMVTGYILRYIPLSWQLGSDIYIYIYPAVMAIWLGTFQ